MEVLHAMRIQKVREETGQSFENLVETYGDSVYQFCRKLTAVRSDADDLFQEVFLRAFEQYGKIIDCENPKGHLFKGAVFIWKDWKRRYARRQRIAPTQPLIDDTPAMGDVDDALMADEDIRAVRETVSALPDKYKIPIILYYTNECTVSDIALSMGLSVGTVKSRLFKARKLIEKGLVTHGYKQ